MLRANDRPAPQSASGAINNGSRWKRIVHVVVVVKRESKLLEGVLPLTPARRSGLLDRWQNQAGQYQEDTSQNSPVATARSHPPAAVGNGCHLAR